MNKRRALKVAVAVLMFVLLAIIAYGIIEYYGRITTTVPVEQAIWVDGKRFNETITETLPPTYGGCTVYANHTLENRGSTDAKVKFVVVNITDSQGNPVTDNTVSVTFLYEGNPIVAPFTVPQHTTITFTIAISFHYAITPDTYTVTVQVQPYVP